jgi:mRNA-decapping enzyme subunit 2
MSAFAEFLAYKQRVPVRGAIMLNEDMDQVVLVKGWKKGANWSFPRGKINKDENDLDCAVREVYEETGFEIREAGLVKDEKEMKYIEVTMREQHMRLYVFRGVPMDTHFEPRTRKEISKIEWYKLTDLPTLKKHKQQDSGELQAVNANKFYMVAPFLNPLKKWISQQRKIEDRQSLPYLAPPVFAESIQQNDIEDSRPPLHQVSSLGPSNLPEVAYTTQEVQDPSADLKRMLNINVSPPAHIAASTSKVVLRADAVKSSALLALLRSGSTAEMRDAPSTPREQISLPTQEPISAQRLPVQEDLFATNPALSRFQVSPDSWHPASSQPGDLPEGFHQRQEVLPSGSQQAPPPLPQRSSVQPFQQVSDASLQRFAPYQNTGDPQFSRSTGDMARISAVPPASALPKLTSHTKSLLDAFKISPAPTLTESAPQAPAVSSVQSTKSPSVQTQTLLDIFKGTPKEAGRHPNPALAPFSVARPIQSSNPMANAAQTPRPDLARDPMNIFAKQSSVPPIKSQAQQLTSVGWQPAELAADTVPQLHVSSKRDKAKPTVRKQDRPAGPREGETAATLSGPLNQPQFDGIIRSARKAANGDRRSPVPVNKTLFDPRNPTPVKILARPENTHGSPGRSPKPAKANLHSSSPRRVATPKESREFPKPFQPQILRRPQTPLGASVESKRETTTNSATAPLLAQPVIDKGQLRPSPAASHKQTLLSLFSNPLQTSHPLSVMHDPVSAISTTVPVSQPISPLTDSQLHGIEPISTRSRVGSLASSGGARRPGVEKRQTTPGNKEFLLGFLGRMASQEGQSSGAS